MRFQSMDACNPSLPTVAAQALPNIEGPRRIRVCSPDAVEACPLTIQREKIVPAGRVHFPKKNRVESRPSIVCG